MLFSKSIFRITIEIEYRGYMIRVSHAYHDLLTPYLPLQIENQNSPVVTRPPQTRFPTKRSICSSIS